MARDLQTDDRGATLAQYGILLALISVVVVATLDKTAVAILGLLNVDITTAAGMPTVAAADDSDPGTGSQAPADAGDQDGKQRHRGHDSRQAEDEKKTGDAGAAGAGNGSASDSGGGAAGTDNAAETMPGSRSCELPIGER